MSARLDKSQTVQFFYGNAMTELKNFLPQDEATERAQKMETQMSVVVSLLDQSLAHINSIQDSKRQLRFLLEDLKRMIG